MAKKEISLRDKRQVEFAEVFLKHGKFGILNLCPRFGKIYTTINILEKLDKDINILIAYPDLKIKEAWEADFKTRKYKNPNITYTTHLSIKKHTGGVFDLVILDEIHLLSEAQIEAVKELKCVSVLGLTGTLASNTEKTLNEELGLNVLATYPIEQAIAEGVITDYEITVIKVPLDDKRINDYKGKKFDLMKFRDNDTGFISMRSKDGQKLKALELPGLWNGSMSDWNTILVEVPSVTFNPVKTVFDLLRPEHL